ncbi:uncharacterized protein LOC123870801 [Maniola jurtina]|uniref:uncharacterized protein LOC123870801 n=1 Tax=Maniola jurtina TaxID=191418 RepID=UPI001E686DE5|nr:uncharacterized protein LOC123870801 [Maniola jurtina]
MNSTIFVIFVVICVVVSMPLEQTKIDPSFELVQEHSISKRFINPSMTSGGFTSNDFSKIRTKRNLEEECEKLELCKLHARSNRSFIAAFQLYFVNKENARLWDHHTHTSADCNRRYSCYR